MKITLLQYLLCHCLVLLQPIIHSCHLFLSVSKKSSSKVSTLIFLHSIPKQYLAHQSIQCMSQNFFTLELTSPYDSFAIHPICNHKCITSFPPWLEAWIIYAAITTVLPKSHSKLQNSNPSSPLLVSSITWLNYDTQFHIATANDPTIRWDTCHSDLLLKWITSHSSSTSVTQPGPLLCLHSGATNHYPGKLSFSCLKYTSG